MQRSFFVAFIIFLILAVTVFCSGITAETDTETRTNRRCRSKEFDHARRNADTFKSFGRRGQHAETAADSGSRSDSG